MGSNAVPHAVKGEDNTYNVDLVGEDLGYLIGRRGDTLDAIQHLANYSINRDVEGHIRISVDAEDYRAKREDSLRKYARKKAQQVLKAHRRTTLEPMNAYVYQTKSVFPLFGSGTFLFKAVSYALLPLHLSERTLSGLRLLLRSWCFLHQLIP